MNEKITFLFMLLLSEIQQPDEILPFLYRNILHQGPYTGSKDLIQLMTIMIESVAYSWNTFFMSPSNSTSKLLKSLNQASVIIDNSHFYYKGCTRLLIFCQDISIQNFQVHFCHQFQFFFKNIF